MLICLFFFLHHICHLCLHQNLICHPGQCPDIYTAALLSLAPPLKSHRVQEDTASSGKKDKPTNLSLVLAMFIRQKDWSQQLTNTANSGATIASRTLQNTNEDRGICVLEDEMRRWLITLTFISVKDKWKRRQNTALRAPSGGETITRQSAVNPSESC